MLCFYENIFSIVVIRMEPSEEEEEDNTTPTKLTAFKVPSKCEGTLCSNAVYKHDMLLGTSSVSLIRGPHNHNKVHIF